MESFPIPYDKFRTGFTYQDVYHMVFHRKWKRRNTVLGFWREIKLRMYEEYLREGRKKKATRQEVKAGSDQEVPW